jgi:hypothetical protein
LTFSAFLNAIHGVISVLQGIFFSIQTVNSYFNLFVVYI